MTLLFHSLQRACRVKTPKEGQTVTAPPAIWVPPLPHPHDGAQTGRRMHSCSRSEIITGKQTEQRQASSGGVVDASIQNWRNSILARRKHVCQENRWAALSELVSCVYHL
ncbi:hypothetical protein SKAU_G00265590 [Synaphobranchus kaupii]|uniref:Uncharacterized protein n=1 Tax=Synaphobranchus kaupii TaxID=118154 RepID=A0A9Q1IP50_SYNKA|nr:hypothetical protein SKAU_G00265590 [Synaphobranchus kaupii]